MAGANEKEWRKKLNNWHGEPMPVIFFKSSKVKVPVEDHDFKMISWRVQEDRDRSMKVQEDSSFLAMDRRVMAGQGILDRT